MNTNMPDQFQLSFLAVGPGRSGTTWLHEALRHHPGLCLPMNVKETMFFDRHHDKGLSWYADHFRHCKPGQLCGEVGPTYFHVPDAPERIKEASPGCRMAPSSMLTGPPSPAAPPESAAGLAGLGAGSGAGGAAPRAATVQKVLDSPNLLQTLHWGGRSGAARQRALCHFHITCHWRGWRSSQESAKNVLIF